MIMKLTGDITERGDGYVLLELAGIGYKVTLPSEVVMRLQGVTSLFIHEAQRDDGREFFGFLSHEALQLFWRLVSVSGVGPKTAQKIVFAGDMSTVRARIAAGDLAFLSAVQGVGKKTAQKIVLELKGVLTDAETSVYTGDEDALQALLSLGYVRRDAETVLARIEETTTEARVRAALKLLSR